MSQALDQRALRAARLLVACLESLRIPHTIVSDTVILVTCARGTDTPLRVDVAIQGPGSFSVDNMLHRDAKVCRTAFADVTEAAGHGRRQAIFRDVSEAPLKSTRKTDRPYGDDPDRVAMREREFRRVPNPPPEAYKEFHRLMDIAKRQFWSKNSGICMKVGIEFGDITTFTYVWLAIFWSTSRRLVPRDPGENGRLFFTFLRQRFGQLFKQAIGQRLRNLPLLLEPEAFENLQNSTVRGSSRGRSEGWYIYDTLKPARASRFK